MKHVWQFSGKKAESDNFDIDDEVLSYIANNIKSNVRELEGALNKLLAYNNLVHIPITMDIAEKELSNIITPDKPREITPQLIIEVVSEHYHISVDQMISKTRSSDVAKPRQIAMYLCKKYDRKPIRYHRFFAWRTRSFHNYPRYQESYRRIRKKKTKLQEI